MATFAFNTDVLRMFYLSELYHMEKYVFVLFMNHLFLPANFYHWIEKNGYSDDEIKFFEQLLQYAQQL